MSDTQSLKTVPLFENTEKSLDTAQKLVFRSSLIEAVDVTAVQ
jgi:hypothetical protein